ncbi:MAG: chorismate mutase [Firmicutes bacterium]|nr:chorismate mutase [Bacillota bacterium]
MKTENIDELRAKIDEIDNEIMASFNKRMKIVEQIAYIKKDDNLSLNDTNREAEVVYKALKNIDRKFADEGKIFIENLITVSKIFQNKILIKN